MVPLPKYQVLVDAIALPGTPKPSGLSYRLVARPTVVNTAQAQVAVIKACVDAALAAQGMSEAPATQAPDLFIEVTYGRDTSTRVDPSLRETYLQLSARTNPQRTVERGNGPEVWDVRSALLGVTGAIESAMPLLATTAVNNVAADTRRESRIEVAQNDPGVEAVRQSAIKILERTLPPPANGGPSASSVLELPKKG
jgi:hypothetical protein